MASLSVNISVETGHEYQVQEISYDGQENYTQPLSLSENFTKLAQKIDFSKVGDEGDDQIQAGTLDQPELHVQDLDGGVKGDGVSGDSKKEMVTFQPSLWPWDSIRSSLKSALTEVSVLCDVLSIVKEKHYMVLDPVSQEAQDQKPFAALLAKKKALAGAAAILLNGADRLRSSQLPDPTGMSRTRLGMHPNFHLELLQMRQNWRLKKVGTAVLGDLSYRSAGSQFWQNGQFKVTKNVQQTPITGTLSLTGEAQQMPNGVEGQVNPPPPPIPTQTSALLVTLPCELEGISYIQVTIQKDTETIASGDLTIPFTGTAGEGRWQQKLEAAQNVLFCKELFTQLAREAVQLQPVIPNLVVGNQITVSLFPGVQLCIGLCHSSSGQRSKSSSNPPKMDHKPVLEHSLHQLLRELHYNALHHPMPHPTTATLGVSKKRRLAGPEAYNRATLIDSEQNETLLEQIIRQTRHVVLRLRTVYMIDSYACEISDPLIMAHWICLNSPTKSSVKININTHGYETICRTPLVIHVGETDLKAICRDGRVINLSYEAQELRNLLVSQVSQHQVNAVQALSKLMGWKVLSTCNNLGIGAPEATGNASSALIASPTGDRIISVHCGPQSKVQVSVSFSPQQKDFYPSTLVRNRRWQHLSGSFREVHWEKMEGKNFLNKMEHLMASLSTT